MNLYDAALVCGKPKKDVVQSWIEAFHAKAATEEEKNQLAAMYAYFMPAPATRAKTTLEWVFKATARGDEARPYLAQVYCDGEYLIATDGKRMHYTPVQDMQVGYYDSKGNYLYEFTKNSNFPEWRRVVGDLNPTYSQTIRLCDLTTKKLGKMFYCTLNLDGNDYPILTPYLDDFCNGDKTALINIKGGDQRILYVSTGENRQGVIMTVRV